MSRPEHIEAVYPASPMQQGLLFHSQAQPHSGLYIEQFIYTIAGTLDTARFHEAWQRVIARHAVLRTAFAFQRDRMLQVVFVRTRVPLVEEDWRNRSEADVEAGLAAYLERDRTRGFEITAAPLMRLAVIRV